MTLVIEINASEYGVTCDGSTDDGPALNAVLAGAPAGSTVAVPTGTGHCRTGEPIVIPPTIALRFPHGNRIDEKSGGWTQSTTYLKPLSTFKGEAVVLLLDKELGGYAADSCEQRISTLTIDGTELAEGSEVDGIRARGRVHGVRLSEVCVMGVSGIALHPEAYERKGGTKVNPYSWRISQFVAMNCEGNGMTAVNFTDCTFIDYQAINCKKGMSVNNLANTIFIGSRCEFSREVDYEISLEGKFGTTTFTAMYADRAERSSVRVFGSGTQPLLIDSCYLKRGGRNAGKGGGEYAGIELEGCSAPVIIGKLVVVPGVDDDGTGVSSPDWGLTAKNCTGVVQIGSESFLHGRLGGIRDLGGNTLIKRGVNIGEQKGTWDSPEALGRKDYGSLVAPPIVAKDHHLKVWNFAPFSGMSGKSPASGKLILIRHVLRDSEEVKRLLAYIHVKGEGLTAEGNWQGLYTIEGTKAILLDQTADQTAKFAEGTKVADSELAGGAHTLEAGEWIQAILCNGTTTPQVGRGSEASSAINNIGLGTAQMRVALNGAGLKALPKEINLEANEPCTPMYFGALG